jgi:hypothetical protein
VISFLPMIANVEDACMQRESNRQQRGCIYGELSKCWGKTKKYLALFSKKVDEREREREKNTNHMRERERDLPLFLPRARARKRDRDN